jgi:hypothetical protein
VVNVNTYTLPTFAGIPAKPFYSRNAVTRLASTSGGSSTAKPNVLQTLFGHRE